MGSDGRGRFAVLDRLILAGWTDTKQDDIPEEVLEAAERGEEIRVRGPARDQRFARGFGLEQPKPKPRPRRPSEKKRRVITPEQRERINANARARWFYKFGPRDRPAKQRQEGNQEECQDVYSAE
jgi:hypothetical protein